MSTKAQNTFPSSGNVGVGTTTPGTGLHVVRGGQGLMGFYYEAAAFENNNDQKLGIYSSSPNFANGSSAITMGSTGLTNNAGYFPGFEMQNINGVLPTDCYLRFNYIERGSTGQVLSAVPDILIVKGNGNVGIGITTPQEKLSVNGKIRSKEVKVENNNWPDYVFDSSYQLPTLQQTETFIKANGHLPEIPSAKQVEKEGVDLGSNQALLLKKVEELTLYLIEMEKKMKKQQELIDKMETKINKVQK